MSCYDGTCWTAHVFDYSTAGQIAIDHDNVVWCTAGNDWAVSYDGSQTRNYYFNLGWESINAPMTEVMVDDDNTKWFTGYRIYSNGTTSYTVTVVDNEIDKYYNPMYFFRSPDNTIWTKRWGKEGGYSIDYLTEYGWIHYISIDFWCNMVAADKTNTLWFVSHGDIYSSEVKGYNNILKVYDGAEWTTYSKLNSDLAGDYIYSLAVDRNDVKWIGTNAGVSRFDGKSWTTFDRYKSRLCNNKINAIAVEKNNTIWFGTDSGISKYTGEVIPVTHVDEKQTIPQSLPVITSYTNPFNPITTIEFTLPEDSYTTLTIYNIAGQKTLDLLAEQMTAGKHTVVWDGKDESGGSVSAGLYFARLKSGEMAVTGKMMMVK